MATSLLAAGELPGTTRVEDPTGLASGALLYRVELAPGESREVDLLAPLIGDMQFKANDWRASAMQAQTAQAWREQLDDVDIDVPPAGQALADTLRTATAYRSDAHTSDIQSLMRISYAVFSLKHKNT